MNKWALICASGLLASCGNLYASGCVVSETTSSDAVDAALEGGWGFKDYDQICAALAVKHAALLVDGGATVLGARSIAWASVRVKDLTLPIVSIKGGGDSIYVNQNASMDVSRSLLRDAIMDAVNHVDVTLNLLQLRISPSTSTFSLLP